MARTTKISRIAAEDVPAKAVDIPSGEDSRTHGVPAVRRASAMLWHLARNPEGLTLSRIARELEIIPSTSLHILRELVAARLAIYDKNSKLYRLGTGVLQLARELTSQNLFAQSVQTHLNRLAREFEVSAQAQERDGKDDIVVVATAIVMSGDIVSVGGRAPVLTSATGRIIAAYSGWSDSELRKRFDRVRWQNPPDFTTWLDEVRATRGRRYAVDEGCFRKGITAIAGAVFSRDGSVERTISVTAVSAQLDAKRQAVMIEAIERAANDVVPPPH